MEEILNPPLLGELKNHPLPFVLGRIGRERLSGFLRLKRGELKKEVVFKEGEPLDVRSNIINECLGRFLQKIGRMDEETYEKSLHVMSAEGRKHGEVLMGMGVISPHELPDLIRQQVREKFLTLFHWGDGVYRFFPSTELPELEFPLELKLFDLLYDGISARFPRERVQAFLEGYRDKPLHRVNHGTLEFSEDRLNLSDRRMLRMVNGQVLIEELLSHSGPDGGALIYALIVSGVLARGVPERSEPERLRLRIEEQEDFIPPEEEPVQIAVSETEEAGPVPLPEPEEPEFAIPKVSERPSGAAPSQQKPAPEVPEEPQVSSEEILRELRSAYEKLRDLDYFGILEVKPDSDNNQVKQSYFRLARRFHPDRFSVRQNKEIKKLSNAVFALISQAHSAIGNEEGRKKYLETLRSSEKQAELEKGAEKMVNAELQYQKGEMFLKQKEYDEAIAALDWAVKLNPEEPEYKMTLGWAMYKKYSAASGEEMKVNQAVKLIKQAVEMNPRLDKGYYHLGLIAKLQNREEEAQNYFSRALEVNPKNLEAQRELRVFEMRRQKTAEKKGTFSRLFKR